MPDTILCDDVAPPRLASPKRQTAPPQRPTAEFVRPRGWPERPSPAKPLAREGAGQDVLAQQCSAPALPSADRFIQAPRVAVLIPCCNEEAAIGKVVADFQAALPQATIYVYDNNSTDRTVLTARAAGALVRNERLQGKGHVVRRMFADIDADAFVLVDGDDTYDAAAAPAMLRLMHEQQLDMVSAARVSDEAELAYRRFHRIGNTLLSGFVRHAFGCGVSDMLSGYRVFSRRFVKSFPALSAGFEIETEFTVHALELRMPMQEVSAPYRGRGAGSSSKLRTLIDGWRILRTILHLIEHERPLLSFGLTALAMLVAGLGLGLPVVWEFVGTGLVPRLPTALLATGLVLLSFLALTCGLVLDALSRGRKELKRMAYLGIRPMGGVL
ncbi:MAG: glycosyltransferase [Rhodospirillales bacterium]|nr:glycosyltransferase [Rhodospirillales bacterium]MBN8926269.1 glycosyltransferase [Rhodospirillales bacterium]